MYGGSVSQVASNEIAMTAQQRAAMEAVLHNILANRQVTQQGNQFDQSMDLQRDAQAQHGSQFDRSLSAQQSQHDAANDIARQHLALQQRQANDLATYHQGLIERENPNKLLETFNARKAYEDQLRAEEDARTAAFSNSLANTGNELLDLDRGMTGFNAAKTRYEAGVKGFHPFRNDDEFRRGIMADIPYNLPIGPSNYEGPPSEADMKAVLQQANPLDARRAALRRYFEGATAKGANADLITIGPDGRYRPTFTPRTAAPGPGTAPGTGGSAAPAARPKFGNFEEGSYIQGQDGSVYVVKGGAPVPL